MKMLLAIVLGLAWALLGKLRVHRWRSLPFILPVSFVCAAKPPPAVSFIVRADGPMPMIGYLVGTNEVRTTSKSFRVKITEGGSVQVWRLPTNSFKPLKIGSPNGPLKTRCDNR